MANAIFSEATTGVAFMLSLSKRQCNTLLRLHQHQKLHGQMSGLDEGPANIAIVSYDSVAPLRLRGLIEYAPSFKGLTRAGELVAELLGEAGLTIENTNTLMTLRRMERAAKRNEEVSA